MTNQNNTPTNMNTPDEATSCWGNKKKRYGLILALAVSIVLVVGIGAGVGTKNSRNKSEVSSAASMAFSSGSSSSSSTSSSSSSTSSSKSSKTSSSKSSKSSSDDTASLDAFQASIAPGAEFEFQRLPGDDRGPCPAMNTLANHGFLNRDGRDIDVVDLAAALEAAFRVSAVTLTNGPIASLGDLNITETNNVTGVTTLTLSAKFRVTPPGQEHDSSFARMDINSGVDDREPSSELISLLLDSSTRDILQPFEIMQYQRNRVEGSCASQEVGNERLYTPTMRGGMAIQGALLFSLAQLREESAYLYLNKANLRSILQLQRFPANFDPDSNFFVDFSNGTPEDDFRDLFRENVEFSINNFCSEENNSEENDDLLEDPFFGNN